jgi:SAM-dependent methyltransferase
MARRGLDLEKVVLLGRTFEEYRRFFALAPADLENRRILDIASGVGSFAAEASAQGLQVTAADPIYEMTPDAIAAQSAIDVERIFREIGGLPVYRWDYYKTPERMSVLRRQAAERFVADFRAAGHSRYVPAALPNLPFPDRSFDLCLVSYFLFAYEARFNYEFHRDSIREVMRLAREEARIYPTVNFEAEKSSYLARLENDPALSHLEFVEISTDFEFLAGSNSYLRIRHRPA